MRRQTLTDHIRDNADAFQNISDAIRAHAAERPGAPAVEDETTALDWQGFDARIDAITAALQQDGIGRGDPSRDPTKELWEVLRRAIDEHEEGWLVST